MFDHDGRRSRRLHRLSAALLLALVLAACGEPTTSDEATDKAQELEAKLSDLAVDLPQGTIAALFGEDGGHICGAADSEDHLALAVLTPNGFALRKLDVDRTHVEIGRAVIDVYCPEKRSTYDDYVTGLAVGESND